MTGAPRALARRPLSCPGVAMTKAHLIAGAATAVFMTWFAPSQSWVDAQDTVRISPALRRADSPGRNYPPDTLRAVGRWVLNRHIARFSRVTNPEWNRDVGMILDRLQLALALPELKITWAIVGDDEINAKAAPGGYLVINAGLVRQFSELAKREHPSDTAAARARYLAYVASVLAHELGHQVLGHTDELMERIKRTQASWEVDTSRAEVEAQLIRVLQDSVFVAERLRSRDAELAADRAGALLMFRSGWEMQQAIDLFRAFDSMERASGSSSLARVTWLRSHPRSSAREAALEAYRAQLKMHQASFDDALTLIQNNVLLDSAVVMLDRVLADLPNLLPALHARAAVVHRQWLRSVPVQALRVRGSLPMYDIHFITGIRGAMGDRALLLEARKGYGSLLSTRLLPYTLSNLAVLDAYAGEMGLARLRADSANALLPNDAGVLNNRGVVMFLDGNYSGAREAFERALYSGQANADPSPIFNLGRALLQLGDTAGAVSALERFVGQDSTSGWSQEAMTIISRATGTRQPVGRAATERSTVRPIAGPPAIAGVALGMSASDVLGALGRPDVTESDTLGPIWGYRERGMLLVVSAQEGVLAITLTKPNAGMINGVRVGDSLSVARARVGSISESEGDVLYFARGRWVLVLRYSGVVVTSVGIALVK